jgi:nucleotide-binding universal stress UspA family protein
MINHILVPLDGSSLAECVLPHISAIAQAFEARITLLQVVDLPEDLIAEHPIDPLDWQLKRREAESYLALIASRLRKTHPEVHDVVLDGPAAQSVIDFAQNTDVDLVALSTHGASGLSGWNTGSVVQKIILRSFKSILLVRAYHSYTDDAADIHYRRLFVGLDCSTRAEFILPAAVKLAQYYRAQLVIGTIIRKPELLYPFPLSTEDQELAARMAARNYELAGHYFAQLHHRFSPLGIDLQSRLVVSENITGALHDMVEQEEPDLVMLAAHGESGEGRWPYGSTATSFITYGTSPLLIVQDLSGDEARHSRAEMAALQAGGH